MAKYIEREAALKSIKETIIGASEFANDIRNSAMNAVNSTPTADVQEVVRCKDCSFYEEIDYFPDGKKYVCKLFNGQMQENDFCSYGTKMDKE